LQPWMIYGSCAVLAAAACVIVAVYAVMTLRRLRQSLNEMDTAMAHGRKILEQTSSSSVMFIQNADKLANELQRDLKSVRGLFESLSHMEQAIEAASTSVRHVSQTITKSVMQVHRASQEHRAQVQEIADWAQTGMELWSRWQANRRSKSSFKEQEYK
jgi:uncharacterized protein YoxC